MSGLEAAIFANIAALTQGLSKKFDPTQYKGSWNKDAAYALGDVVQDLNTGKFWQAQGAVPVGNGTGPTTPSYVGTWKQERLSTTTGTTYSISVPAGAVQVGDFMVAGYSTGTSGGNDQPQPAAGWSWLRTDIGLGSTNYHWYSKVATAADVSGGVSFSVSGVNSGFSAVVQAFRNVGAYSHGGGFASANTATLTGSWANGIIIPSASHLEAVVGFFGTKTLGGTYSSTPTGTGLTTGSNVLPNPLPTSGSSAAGMYVFGWNTVTTSTTPLTLSVTAGANVYVGALALALTAYQTPSGTYWTEVPGVGASLDTLIPAPTFIPSPKPPAEITLRQTLTASGPVDKTGYPEWVYVVAVGGGGAGNAGAGGGGGACIQGWMKSSIITDVTIGAGGTGTSNSGPGNPTLIGGIRAGGGGLGSSAASPDVNDMAYALTVEAGAAHGGINSSSLAAPPTTGFQHGRDNLAFGMFLGGKSGTSVTLSMRATSGAGGTNNRSGQNADGGPGGGSGTGASQFGGNSTSPNGSNYIGGVSVSGAGGGGAGILASGAAAVSTTGGAGGLGGGGGGAGTVGGNGGNGAVLIFW